MRGWGERQGFKCRLIALWRGSLFVKWAGMVVRPYGQLASNTWHIPYPPWQACSSRSGTRPTGASFSSAGRDARPPRSARIPACDTLFARQNIRTERRSRRTAGTRQGRSAERPVPLCSPRRPEWPATAGILRSCHTTNDYQRVCGVLRINCRPDRGFRACSKAMSAFMSC